MAQLTLKELKRNELTWVKPEPNVVKRSMYQKMEKSGDIDSLKSCIREVLEDAGLKEKMKVWTAGCMSRQNPEVFNKRSMTDKLIRVGRAAIDMPTLKTEVAKKLVVKKHDKSYQKQPASKSSGSGYSKAYAYV